MGFKKLAARFHVDAKRSSRFVMDSLALGGDAKPALQLLYAGDGNAAWKSALAKRKPEMQGASDKQSASIWADIVAESVVAGWDHVTDDDGTPCTFTVDKAKELLAELVAGDGGVDVLNSILRHAQNPENYRGAAPAASEVGKG